MWLYEVLSNSLALFHGGVTKWKKETQDNGWTSCVSYIFDIEIVMVMLSQRCKSWNALTDRVVGSGVIQASSLEGGQRSHACNMHVCVICSNAVNQMIVFLAKQWIIIKNTFVIPERFEHTPTLMHNSLCTIWGHIEKGTRGIFKDPIRSYEKTRWRFLMKSNDVKIYTIFL